MARHTKSKVNLINKSYFAELLLENCKQFVRVFLLWIFCFIGNHFTRSPDISWAHTDRSRSFSVSFQLDLKFWSGVKDWKFRLMKTISLYTHAAMSCRNYLLKYGGDQRWLSLFKNKMVVFCDESTSSFLKIKDLIISKWE